MVTGRIGEFFRKTGETDISVTLNLDGSGVFQGSTGIGFFDHMLHLWTKHSLFNLSLDVTGDLHVDFHHTVEDVGICLGSAVRIALGDKVGISRYGSLILPMDETLVLAALDISGRGYLNFDVPMLQARVGNFDTELVEEFFRAFVAHSGITLHFKLLEGKNTHHVIEAVFKAFARALRAAVTYDNRIDGVLSTKGTL